MRLFILSIFCFLIFISTEAQADCSSPAGTEGKQIYNTTHKVMQFCNGTDWIGMAGGATASASSTIVSGWPDAIRCSSSNGNFILYNIVETTSNQTVYKYPHDSTSRDLRFNTSDGTYASSNNLSGADCVSKPISQLYTEGLAFNFVGGGTSGSSPSGAVMAFDLASCPSGWSEYTAARGRFIRGIDSTGTIDPDGVRVAGSTQEDEFKSHEHIPQNSYNGSGSSYGGHYQRGHNNGVVAPAGNAEGGAETRPKNVALLYCRKD